MSLKCSIFGCKWGDTEVEREREEDGSEVITTIRETVTCTRCGDVRVVSENKEVTTLETAADIVADDLEEEGTADPAPAGTGSEEAAPPQETDTHPPTAGDDAGATIPDAESDAAVTTGSSGGGPTGSPSEDMDDDAVILDDGPEETEAPAEEEAASEAESLQEADPDGEAEILDGPEPDDGDSERGPGEWPEEPDDGDDWEQPTDVDHVVDEENGFGTVGNAVTVPEGEFYCPECEYSTSVESSSLREGDYCPECHRGSLKHRPE